MAPLVRRTWAPVGHTPVLYQRTGACEKVSLIGVLALSPRRRRVRLFFALRPGQNVTVDNLIPFLQDLRIHLGGRFVLIWDRLNVHKAVRMQHFLAGLKHVRVAFLPPYAPELNPVEGLWGYLKMNPLANHAPLDLDDLARSAADILPAVSLDEDLLRSFLTRTPLFLSLE
jgi:hypothetical protein